MAKHAVVNSDNVVENVIVWDESSDWRPPEGRVLVNVDEIFCDIGWHHNNGTFTNPNPPVQE